MTDGQGEILTRASKANVDIMLKMVVVRNEMKKPGPVLLEMAVVAYGIGAEYFYRVNDDTEFMQPWAKVYSHAIQVSYV